MCAKMGRLSGWQRLWLVLAILYLIAVVIFAVTVMPMKSDIERRWALDVIEISKKYDPLLSNKSTWKILESYKGFSQEEIIELNIRFALKTDKDTKGKVNWSKELNKKRFQELEEYYTEKLGNLYWKKAKVVGLSFLVWIVPVVVVYILGLIVRWIYTGFKTDYSKKE